MRKPILICLIGLPGLGKSTWREQYLSSHDFDGFVASTDDIVDEWAAEQGKTYNEIYHDSIGAATELFDKICHLAFTKRKDLIVDRTNMNKKIRDRYMRRARNAGYEVRAIVFQAPVSVEDEAEWHKRLASRPGKTIPEHVLKVMHSKYEPPLPEEGFDFIGIIDTFRLPSMLQVMYENSLS